MARCDFCQQKIEPGCGKLYIKKDGKTFDFCSRKCETHMLKLKHKPRTTKWTLEAKRVKKEKMQTDADAKVKDHAKQEKQAAEKKNEPKKADSKPAKPEAKKEHKESKK